MLPEGIISNVLNNVLSDVAVEEAVFCNLGCDVWETIQKYIDIVSGNCDSSINENQMNHLIAGIMDYGVLLRLEV